MTSRIPRALSSIETAAVRPPMSVRTHPGWMTTARHPRSRHCRLEGTEAVVERRLRVPVLPEASRRSAARAHHAGDEGDLPPLASQHRVHQRFGDLDRGLGVDAIDGGGPHAAAVDAGVVDEDVDGLVLRGRREARAAARGRSPRSPWTCTSPATSPSAPGRSGARVVACTRQPSLAYRSTSPRPIPRLAPMIATVGMIAPPCSTDSGRALAAPFGLSARSFSAPPFFIRCRPDAGRTRLPPASSLSWTMARRSEGTWP